MFRKQRNDATEEKLKPGENQTLLIGILVKPLKRPAGRPVHESSASDEVEEVSPVESDSVC